MSNIEGIKRAVKEYVKAEKELERKLDKAVEDVRQSRQEPKAQSTRPT